MNTTEKTSAILLAAVALTACRVLAGTLDFATRVSCELQTASGTSLSRMTWQQGTTPLLSVEQFRLGKAIAADTNTDAVVVIGPSATSQYYVAVTNQSTSGNSYLVQMPTIGTNAASWWYTVYFERSGQRYWTGNGTLAIEATTSTGDGLVWQTITGGSVAALQSALDAEAQARASGDVVAMTNWQARVNSLTNGAALGAAALQPSWAATGIVYRALFGDNAAFAGTAYELSRPSTDGDALDAATAHIDDPAAHPDIRDAISALPSFATLNASNTADRAYATNAIAIHNTNGLAHADIRDAINASNLVTRALIGPTNGCTELTGTTPVVSGVTKNYFLLATNDYSLSVDSYAPRAEYTVEIFSEGAVHSCTLSSIDLIGSWTVTGTNVVVLVPSTGTVWHAYGRGL